MRTTIACLAALSIAVACSVSDKKPIDPDAGVPDGGTGGPPDGAAPDTTIELAPDEFSRADQATFRFSSSDASATFMCRLDDEDAQPCQSPYVRTLPDGSHSFSVRAVDPAGNSDDSPAEHLWTIDTVAPDTTLVDGPPRADNSVMPVFTFRSAEANVVFDCSLDNAGFAPCTSGSEFGPVVDGAHAFAVRARDRAGNVDASPAVFAWTVDISTPDTQVLSGPAEASASASTTVSFTFISPDAGAGASFQCSLDGGDFTACTSPRTYDGLDEGVHTFAVRVRDVFGNFDPSPADRSWRVDLTPPGTTIFAGPSGAMPAASASVTFTSSEADVAFTCSLDGAAFTPCTSPANLMALAQGSHTFAVLATDAAGNSDGSPATASWTVDTVVPDIAITGGPEPASTVGPRVIVGFTVSEGDVACSLDGVGLPACTSPLAFNLPAGSHQLTVLATDAAGNATSVARTWTVACNPPAAAGAAGVLHLDDAGQMLANATGGAPATLGATPEAEPGDPVALAGARFGGGLAFAAAAESHVTWPVALPATSELTIELWARPAASAGPRDLVISSDGRLALRVAAASDNAVVFSLAVSEGAERPARTVSSAAVAADAWHHVLASLSPPTLQLWVDGVPAELGGVELAAPLALDALRLGGAGGAAYDGALDEIWLSQTAISNAEAALGRYCPL